MTTHQQARGWWIGSFSQGSLNLGQRLMNLHNLFLETPRISLAWVGCILSLVKNTFSYGISS